ncbi:MAG: HIT family protein [Thermoplasmata archaeon]|nr:HIT family protein [Thermoplasmata archaeon]
MAASVPEGGVCIFCDIVARRAPGHILYEDDTSLAFLDIFPFTRGHLLVIPKRHVDRITDLPETEYAPFLHALAVLCRRVDRLSTHYNVALNQGALAGQIVFHLHFHVIPRYGNANPFGVSPRERLSDEAARSIVADLAEAP